MPHLNETTRYLKFCYISILTNLLWKFGDNVTEASTFTTTVTQNTYKINHQLNCSKK